jgi:hypothetical protein
MRSVTAFLFFACLTFLLLLLPCSADEEDHPGSDWNIRFQLLITELRSQDYYTPMEDRIRTNMALLHLSQDFIHAAKVC